MPAAADVTLKILRAPAAEEATDLFPESREDELNKGLCGQTLLMYLH